MKLYLETVSFDEFIEINQYIPLDGIYLSMDQLLKDPAAYSVEKTAGKLLEALMPDQQLIVPVIQSDFRSMVDVCRKLHELGSNIVCLLPVSPAGYMAMKVCSRKRIPSAAWNVLNPEQMLFAARNEATWQIADLEELEKSISLPDFLQQVKALPDQTAQNTLILSGIRKPADFRTGLLGGAAGMAADYGLYQELLLNQQTMKEQSEILQNWMEKELNAEDLEDSEPDQDSQEDLTKNLE